MSESLLLKPAEAANELRISRAMSPLLLSVNDAAAALGIGPAQMWRLLAAHEVESVKIGRRRLIPAEALEDYVARIRLEQAV